MRAISLAGLHLSFRSLGSGELHAIDSHLRHYVEKGTDPSRGGGENDVYILTRQWNTRRDVLSLILPLFPRPLKYTSGTLISGRTCFCPSEPLKDFVVPPLNLLQNPFRTRALNVRLDSSLHWELIGVACAQDRFKRLHPGVQ